MPAYPLITVNGVALDDPSDRWGIAPDQALRGVPGRGSVSVSIPGAPGVTAPAWVPREAFQFPVSLLVVGAGATISDRENTLHQYLDALSFLFENNGELYPLVYQSGPSTSWTAQVRLLSSATPAFIGNDAAVVTFLVDCPEGSWRGAEVQQTFITPHTNPLTLSLLTGGGSEISDAKFLIRGPFTTATITDPVTGQWVKCGTAATSAQWIRIDCGLFTATRVTTASFTAGGTDVTNGISNGGRGAGSSWLRLFPRMVATDPINRDVKLTVTYTGATNGTTSFSYAARKAS